MEKTHFVFEILHQSEKNNGVIYSIYIRVRANINSYEFRTLTEKLYGKVDFFLMNISISLEK